jgi:hypothetical protein
MNERLARSVVGERVPQSLGVVGRKRELNVVALFGARSVGADGEVEQELPAGSAADRKGHGDESRSMARSLLTGLGGRREHDGAYSWCLTGTCYVDQLDQLQLETRRVPGPERAGHDDQYIQSTHHGDGLHDAAPVPQPTNYIPPVAPPVVRHQAQTSAPLTRRQWRSPPRKPRMPHNGLYVTDHQRMAYFASGRLRRR